MDVVHITQADNGMILVTYALTAEEFKEIQDKAKALEEVNNEDDISGSPVQ
jgi:hypothetical protein